MKKIVSISLSLLVGVLLVGCVSQKKTTEPSPSESKPKVITTFYPMYEFTKAVVGDEIEVELLIKASVEAHDYEPSGKDMGRLSEADAVVFNSPEMETWIKKVQENTADKVRFIEAAKEIPLMSGHQHSHEEGDEVEAHENHEDQEAHGDHDNHTGEEAHDGLDPHVWLDPQLAQIEVATIAVALGQVYPEKATQFKENADQYINQLKDLDQSFVTTLADKKERTFVTQHEAFGYLAKRYDLDQNAISGLSSDEEPSPKRLAELKKVIQEKEIETVYFEGNASTKVAHTLAKETGVKTSVLHTLESLSEKEQANGASYLTVMAENLKNLEKGIC